MDVLAIDVGGTKLAAAVVRPDGSVASEARRATRADAGADELFADLVGVAREAIAGTGSTPEATAVGCGGPMRWPEGTVSPLYIPAWRDFPLGERLEAAFGLPCVVDNDAKAMALGEWWLGAGRETRNMLGMVVSTGMGGGLIVDGRLLDGGSGNAGHIGHVIVEPDGPLCPCGARGCAGAIASGTALPLRYRERGGSATNAAEVAAAARAGDERAVEVFQDAARAIGRAIASAAALCDLDLVVLGGSVALATWDLFELPLHRELAARARLSFSRSLRIARAELGPRAGIVGAAALFYRPTR